MATHQAERVVASGSPSGGASLGTCVRVAGGSGSSTVTVRRAGCPDVELVLPVAPDRDLAQHLTGGYRRLSWVSIDARGPGCQCEVACLSRRPQRVRLPLAAALALADAAVPTIVRVPDRT